MLAFYLAVHEVENDRRALNVFFGMRRAKKEGRWVAIASIGYKNRRTENGVKYIASKPFKNTCEVLIFDVLITIDISKEFVMIIYFFP